MWKRNDSKESGKHKGSPKREHYGPKSDNGDNKAMNDKAAAKYNRYLHFYTDKQE